MITYAQYSITDLTDGASIWTTTVAPTLPDYTFIISNLSGRPAGTIPQVGDIIVYSYYRYTITEVMSGYLYPAETLFPSDLLFPIDAPVATVKAEYRESIKGTGVKSITELYYCSDSSTIPAKPTSHVEPSETEYNKWNLTCPTWTSTYQYYFTCSEILYDNGIYDWSDPVSNGGYETANQTAAKSAASIIRWYYKSTSPTECKGGSWTKDAPKWEAGYYIWYYDVYYSKDGSEINRTVAINSTGQDGKAGGSLYTATLYMYANAESNPGEPKLTEDQHYNFNTKDLTNIPDGWYLYKNLPPTGDNQYTYITTTTVTSVDLTLGIIHNGDWSNPVRMTGEHGYNSAQVRLYSRNVEINVDPAETDPATIPGILTYNFSTGKIVDTSTIEDYWNESSSEAPGDGALVITTASVVGQSNTVDIDKSDWSITVGFEANSQNVFEITQNYALTTNYNLPTDISLCYLPTASQEYPYIWEKQINYYSEKSNTTEELVNSSISITDLTADAKYVCITKLLGNTTSSGSVLSHSKVTKIESYSSSGLLIDSINLPNELLELVGYGQSYTYNEVTYRNYWENNVYYEFGTYNESGEWIWYDATHYSANIVSTVLTDLLLEVVNNGSIKFYDSNGNNISSGYKAKYSIGATDYYESVKLSNNYSIDGTPGNPGKSAEIGKLSNESYIFPSIINSTDEYECSTILTHYSGNDKVKIKILNINGNPVSSVPTPSEIFIEDGVYVSLSNNTEEAGDYLSSILIKVRITSNILSGADPYGSKILGIVYCTETDPDESNTINFNYILSRRGPDGRTSGTLSLMASSQIFKSTDGGITFSPDVVTITPTFQESKFVSWQYYDENLNLVTIDSSYYDDSYVLSIPRDFVGYTNNSTSITFICTAAVTIDSGESNINDSVTISRLYDVTDIVVGGTNLFSTCTATWSSYDSSTGSNISNSYSVLVDDTGDGIGVALAVNDSASIPPSKTVFNGCMPFKDDNVTMYANCDFTIGFYARLKCDESYSESLQTDAEVTVSTFVPGSSKTFQLDATNWTYCYYTFTGIFTSVNNSIEFYSNINPTPGAYVVIKNIKVEVGNKCTNWNLSEKDKMYQLNYLKQSIQKQTQYFFTLSEEKGLVISTQNESESEVVSIQTNKSYQFCNGVKVTDGVVDTTNKQVLLEIAPSGIISSSMYVDSQISYGKYSSNGGELTLEGKWSTRIESYTASDSTIRYNLNDVWIG